MDRVAVKEKGFLSEAENIQKAERLVKIILGVNVTNEQIYMFNKTEEMQHVTEQLRNRKSVLHPEEYQWQKT